MKKGLEYLSLSILDQRNKPLRSSDYTKSIGLEGMKKKSQLSINIESIEFDTHIFHAALRYFEDFLVYLVH